MRSVEVNDFYLYNMKVLGVDKTQAKAFGKNVEIIEEKEKEDVNNSATESHN